MYQSGCPHLENETPFRLPGSPPPRRSLAAALGLLGFIRTIELKTYDLRVAATARPSAPSDAITLVAIDDDSIKRMEPLVGRWPWPRLVHATLIDYLSAGGAKVIAYDILFAERDLKKFMVGDTEWTGAESDAALVESTRKAGNVIHVAEAASPELKEIRSISVGRVQSWMTTWPPLTSHSWADVRRAAPGVTPPFPRLPAASRGIGHTLLVLDSDGPVRRSSPLVRFSRQAHPIVAAGGGDDGSRSHRRRRQRDENTSLTGR